MSNFSDPPTFQQAPHPSLTEINELLRVLCSIDLSAAPSPDERELQAQAKLTITRGLEACRRYFEQITPR